MALVARAVLVAFVCFGGSPLAAAAEPKLETRLDAALAVRALRGARVAALVVDRDDGRELYARDPDRALTPASNLKLFTATAALHAFGPTHRFVTQLLSDESPDAKGFVETLYVRGGGDPALTSEDFWRLAADLRRAGLRGVRGDIVLDDSMFDGVRWHPAWGAVSARAYHAPVSALTVNYGAFTVTLAPGRDEGDAVRAVVDPPVAFFRLNNRAHTGPSGARRTLRVDRHAAAMAGVERVEVAGVAPAEGESKTFARSVLDATRYAGAVLRMQLAAVGISVGGETRLGYAPESAIELLAFEGPQMAEVVRLFLKYSNNSIGEALVKNLGVRANGAPGTWQDGMSALRAELTAAGVSLQGVTLVDGSGLSYENRATPRSLVDALRRAAGSFRFGPEFVAALPIAGSDGTLEDRTESAVGLARAKTGLLTRVTGLSGIVPRAGGGAAYFSVLVNGFRSNATDAMTALDGFVEALVADQERPAVSP